MQSEYGVETQLEPLSFSVARWVNGGWPVLEKVGRMFNCSTVKDQVSLLPHLPCILNHTEDQDTSDVGHPVDQHTCVRLTVLSTVWLWITYILFKFLVSFFSWGSERVLPDCKTEYLGPCWKEKLNVHRCGRWELTYFFCMYIAVGAPCIAIPKWVERVTASGMDPSSHSDREFRT